MAAARASPLQALSRAGMGDDPSRRSVPASENETTGAVCICV